jgi:hypothetical protein
MPSAQGHNGRYASFPKRSTGRSKHGHETGIDAPLSINIPINGIYSCHIILAGGYNIHESRSTNEPQGCRSWAAAAISFTHARSHSAATPAQPNLHSMSPHARQSLRPYLQPPPEPPPEPLPEPLPKPLPEPPPEPLPEPFLEPFSELLLQTLSGPCLEPFSERLPQPLLPLIMANLDNNPMSKENADSLIATALRYKKKLPPGRWKTFDVSTNENIPKQIFEQNHSAWIVYALALAQVNSTHKFTQKDDCRQFLKTIDNSNLDTFVKLVDERIRHLDPKEQGRIQKFCEQAERRRKKRRRLYSKPLIS